MTGRPSAPLHPTATGELAIALADQQVLPEVEGLVPRPRLVVLRRNRYRHHRDREDGQAQLSAGMISSPYAARVCSSWSCIR